ncbi:phage shock protein A [Novosphingobium chloroacetimidivorans]|uniref:Phage shock protein A n=1 Tax=Novosphingobium chloroacetimidivorans TaxID=1428314 RepID=A0A7W7K9W1_9SPHN|nr:phage shock protein PspA [Novosphingobium chloroacetimidivorans]MBB4858198.1 phage shock protein A [Novosphingobium chloroacetimidivorans]
MTRLDAEIADLRGQRQALPAPLLTLDGLDEPGSTTTRPRAYYHNQSDRPFTTGRHSIRKAPPAMGIFSRTRDIIAANFNDLLEKAEDPAKMIRLIILEMEETLVEVRTSSARTIADQKEMRRHVAKLDKLQADWSDKAQLALSKEREDLARAALLERKKAADMADQLKSEIEVLDDALRAYEADIEKLQNRLREARTRQSSIAARLQSAENRVKLRTLLSSERVDEAMVRFDQLERRVDYAEGRAESMSLGDARQPSLADEIAALENGDSIEAELAEMKRQMGDKPAATSN